MKRSLAFLVVLFAFGCAPSLPSYSFSAPLPRVEEWTRIYPASRDRGPLKFLLANDATGAHIGFLSDPSFYRPPASLAGELKVRFAQAGFEPSDIVEPFPPGRRASFRISGARRGIMGKIVVFRPEGFRECVVAVGHWPTENDDRALDDMDAIMADIVVSSAD